MSGKNKNFDDKKIKRSGLYKNKKINNIEDIDVNNILISKKEPYGRMAILDILENLMKMQQCLL